MPKLSKPSCDAWYQLAARRALLPNSKAFATHSTRSPARAPPLDSSTRCPAGCDLKFCPKLRDSSAPCDVFELSPQRAAKILELGNNYHRAVHAVRLKNKLCGVNELSRSSPPATAPSPASPAPAPASSPSTSAPAPAPGSRAMMLKTQIDVLTEKLDEITCSSCDKEKPAAPRLY